MLDDGGLSLRDLVLRLDGRIEGYIISHEARHSAESAADMAARGDPSQSAAGRAIMNSIQGVADDVAQLAGTVRSHERTLQRMTGAMTLLTALGIGTVGLVALRIAGIVP